MFYSELKNKFYTFVARRRWLRRLNLISLPESGWIQWKGKPFFVSLNDWQGPSFHVLREGVESYEADLFSCMQKIVGEKGIYLDVGANIGILSFRMAEAHPQSQIFCFEPTKMVASRIRETLRARGLQNMILTEAAVSSHAGRASLFVDQSNHGGHSLDSQSILDEGGQITTQQPVEMITLDEFVREKKLSNIDLIKVDVQRHEYDVLKGALFVLQNQRPVLMIECFIEDFSEKNSVVSILREQNYGLFDPRKRNFIPHLQVQAKDLYNSGEVYRDLFFIPAEKMTSYQEVLT